MTKKQIQIQILKLAMGAAYCGETYYDYLEPEEIEFICNAMETYAEQEKEKLLEAEQ